jgi:hypothetical protein
VRLSGRRDSIVLELHGSPDVVCRTVISATRGFAAGGRCVPRRSPGRPPGPRRQAAGWDRRSAGHEVGQGLMAAGHPDGENARSPGEGYRGAVPRRHQHPPGRPQPVEVRGVGHVVQDHQPRLSRPGQPGEEPVGGRLGVVRRGAFPSARQTPGRTQTAPGRGWPRSARPAGGPGRPATTFARDARPVASSRCRRARRARAAPARSARASYPGHPNPAGGPGLRPGREAISQRGNCP